MQYLFGSTVTWQKAMSSNLGNALPFFKKWADSLFTSGVLPNFTILKQRQSCTAESTTCVFARKTPTCINTTKIVIHIFNAETVTCKSAAETSNYIISTEIVTCVIATERPTNITTSKTTNCIVAMESQNLNNCFRRYHLHNSCRECQLHSSNRKFHLTN